VIEVIAGCAIGNFFRRLDLDVGAHIAQYSDVALIGVSTRP
jgi:hypothetical protein